jgi:hypothetical protein
VSLWKLAALNPCISPRERETLKQRLSQYHTTVVEKVRNLFFVIRIKVTHQSDAYPLEDPDANPDPDFYLMQTLKQRLSQYHTTVVEKVPTLFLSSNFKISGFATEDQILAISLYLLVATVAYFFPMAWFRSELVRNESGSSNFTSSADPDAENQIKADPVLTLPLQLKVEFFYVSPYLIFSYYENTPG